MALREKYQAMAIEEIRDFSQWCLDGTGEGGELQGLPLYDAYHLAEVLTELKWAIAAWQANIDDAERLLAEISRLVSNYPKAVKFREGAQRVEAAIRDYLAVHFFRGSGPTTEEIEFIQEWNRNLWIR